jgi:aspartyl-tRNA(Asn)/glutamyl-tRNA(Gln) amidotransferase subunit C
MPKVTAATVEHVARLAQLSLTTDERETFARQLDGILAYAETIQSLDTAAVEPMSHATLSEVFRDDVARPGLERARVLAEAPDADAGLFRVPKVIGG